MITISILLAVICLLSMIILGSTELESAALFIAEIAFIVAGTWLGTIVLIAATDFFLL